MKFLPYILILVLGKILSLNIFNKQMFKFFVVCIENGNFQWFLAPEMPLGLHRFEFVRNLTTESVK